MIKKYSQSLILTLGVLFYISAFMYHTALSLDHHQFFPHSFDLSLHTTIIGIGLHFLIFFLIVVCLGFLLTISFIVTRKYSKDLKYMLRTVFFFFIIDGWSNDAFSTFRFTAMAATFFSFTGKLIGQKVNVKRTGRSDC